MEQNRTIVIARAIAGDEQILPVLEIVVIGEALWLAGAIGQALQTRYQHRLAPLLKKAAASATPNAFGAGTTGA